MHLKYVNKYKALFPLKYILIFPFYLDIIICRYFVLLDKNHFKTGDNVILWGENYYFRVLRDLKCPASVWLWLY